MIVKMSGGDGHDVNSCNALEGQLVISSSGEKQGRQSKLLANQRCQSCPWCPVRGASRVFALDDRILQCT